MSYFAMKVGDTAQLRHELASLIGNDDAAGYWFALVDKAFDHDKPGLRMADATETVLYHQGKFEALSPVSPVLIELPREASSLDERLKRLVRHCKGRPMLSVLKAACPAMQLSDDWQGLLETETDGKERFLLRFADTRVLPTLALIDIIWNRLAAPVSAWWIVGRNGQWQPLPQPATRIYDHEPLAIDEGAYAQLLSAGSADAMAAYLDEHFPDLLTGRNGYANHLLLEQLANLCERSGIDGSSEQHALAVALMLTEGRLMETTGFTEWLAEKPWPTGGLEDALEIWMAERGLI